MEFLRVWLEKQLLIKHYVIKHFQNMMDIKEVLLQLFINFFDKKSLGGAIKSETMANQGLGEELHKPIIRKV